MSIGCMYYVGKLHYVGIMTGVGRMQVSCQQGVGMLADCKYQTGVDVTSVEQVLCQQGVGMLTNQVSGEVQLSCRQSRYYISRVGSMLQAAGIMTGVGIISKDHTGRLHYHEMYVSYWQNVGIMLVGCRHRYVQDWCNGS